MTFGDKVAGILDDQEKAAPKWDGLLGEILQDLIRLEAGLVEMKMEAAFLEEAGMWSAVPTESWEARNGGDRVYLRLLLPAGTNGQRRCRVYIGSKPEAIADARRKSANRIRWERLDKEIHDLEQKLRYVEMALKRQRSAVQFYQLPDLSGRQADLGTPAAPARPALVPKMGADHA